jgi:hypothetical protein
VFLAVISFSFFVIAYRFYNNAATKPFIFAMYWVVGMSFFLVFEGRYIA